MKTNILSEIARVREIMGLREQRKETIITDTIKSDVDVPIPPIKGKYDVGDSDPSEFIKDSVVSIISSLPQKAKDKLDEGKLQLVQITVKAGASNYWDRTTGPTQYDHEIVGDDYVPTTDGKGEGLSEDGYEFNMELAELRASTYIEEVKPLLEEAGVIVGDKLSKIPQGMVVYTGGKNDKPTCTTDCGQVLILTLSFIYTDTIEKTIDVCLPEIEISVGVLGQADDNHVCDEAIFKVSVNGEKIGVANLNNGDFDTFAYKLKDGVRWDHAGWPYDTAGPLRDKYHMAPYQKIKGQNSKKRTTDGKKGGVRTWTTIIDTKNEKYNWGDVNKLTITPLVKTQGSMSYIGKTLLCAPPRKEQGVFLQGTYGDGGRPCGSHSEVPMLL